MSEFIDLDIDYESNLTVPDYNTLFDHLTDELTAFWREFDGDYESDAKFPLKQMAARCKGFPPGSGLEFDEVPAFDFNYSPVSRRTITAAFSDANQPDEKPSFGMLLGINERECFEEGRDYAEHDVQPDAGLYEELWPINPIYIWRLVRVIMTTLPVSSVVGNEWYFPKSWTREHKVTSMVEVEKLIHEGCV